MCGGATKSKFCCPPTLVIRIMNIIKTIIRKRELTISLYQRQEIEILSLLTLI